MKSKNGYDLDALSKAAHDYRISRVDAIYGAENFERQYMARYDAAFHKALRYAYENKVTIAGLVKATGYRGQQIMQTLHDLGYKVFEEAE